MVGGGGQTGPAAEGRGWQSRKSEAGRGAEYNWGGGGETKQIVHQKGTRETSCQSSCPEHSLVPEEGGHWECQPKAQAQPAKGCLGEFPELLVMGTLGKCRRNSGRFPFLPQEHRRTGSGDGHETCGCYREEAQGVSRILHQDWGALPCLNPLTMEACHPEPRPLVKAKGCATAPILWPGQKI